MNKVFLGDLIKYSELNSKQKENYNYTILAACLARYGYECNRLHNDYHGADLIATSNDGEVLKIQLKGRFTVNKKYIGKNLIIAFIENGSLRLYDHDTAVNHLTDNILSGTDWVDRGLYTWNRTPSRYDSIITDYSI